MIRYHKPDRVNPIFHGNRILLTTQEGGQVWIDRVVLELFQAADQRSLDQIIENFHLFSSNEMQIRAGLACLAEAGLLEREFVGEASPPNMPIPRHPEEVGVHALDELVSVIIVSYNSLRWLADCIDSLAAPSADKKHPYAPIEIIVVDNASQDGSPDWVEQRIQDYAQNGQQPHQPIRLLRLDQTTTLARAINTGIGAASGGYYLLLNPDVRVDPEAIDQMVKTARANSNCAAVSAKLRLMWTPAFLNGVGNLVGALSWGVDLGLGQLDLGQFDHWDQIPSACFAAALIPAQMIPSVGLLDGDFAMYYEDSEWCYRARLFGYTVHLAPEAVVYHAFSAQNPVKVSTQNEASQKPEASGIKPLKLQRVTSGRLRFITRINGAGYFWRFLCNYLIEDLIRILSYLIFTRAEIGARVEMASAFPRGWKDFFVSLPAILIERKSIQARRKINDQTLYRLQNEAAAPLIESGMPVFNWDAICSHYLPLIAAGKTRRLPEFSDENMAGNGSDPAGQLGGLRNQFRQTSAANISERTGLVSRLIQIYQTEGLGALLRRLGRQIQWRMMQP